MAKPKTLKQLLQDVLKEGTQFKRTTGNVDSEQDYWEGYQEVLIYLKDIEVFMPNPKRNQEMTGLVGDLLNGYLAYRNQISEKIYKCVDMVGKDD